jgi:hypothetical protein
LCCTMEAASSKSELVIVRGFFEQYKLVQVVSSWNRDFNRTDPLVDDSAALPVVVGRSCRRVEAGNQTSPMPEHAASCAPTSSGLGCGTILYACRGLAS